MTTQLHTAMVAIMAMPYFKNAHAQSGSVTHGHETAVADVLSQHGFTSLPKSAWPKLTKSLLRTWAETGDSAALVQATVGMPPGSFIVQPAGSQGFPDILVLDTNQRFIALECKSGQNGLCPMWNDNLPKPQAIYILSSGAANATTVFMGRDVITAAEQAVMDQQEAEMAQVAARYRALLLKMDQHNRGFHQKSRKQHFQSGGALRTNYFTHADRSQCETNVLLYANE